MCTWTIPGTTVSSGGTGKLSTIANGGLLLM